MIQCTIFRDKSGLNRFSPKFSLLLSKGFRFLMCSKKKPTCSTSYYVVSMNLKNIDSDGPFSIGKLRGDAKSH